MKFTQSWGLLLAVAFGASVLASGSMLWADPPDHAHPGGGKAGGGGGGGDSATYSAAHTGNVWGFISGMEKDSTIASIHGAATLTFFDPIASELIALDGGGNDPLDDSEINDDGTVTLSGELTIRVDTFDDLTPSERAQWRFTWPGQDDYTYILKVAWVPWDAALRPVPQRNFPEDSTIQFNLLPFQVDRRLKQGRPHVQTISGYASNVAVSFTVETSQD